MLTRKSLGLLVAGAFMVAPGAAHAASISISLPPTMYTGDRTPGTIAVDPTGLTDTAPTLTVAQLAAATPCPAGPRFVTGFINASFDAAAGPQTVPFYIDPGIAGSYHLCAWLSENQSADVAEFGPVETAFTATDKINYVTPDVTAAWGFNTDKRKCRVEGQVTPRATGVVVVQRASGKKWINVITLKLKGQKYAGYFKGVKGKTYRVAFPGQGVILPGVSLSHKMGKIAKYGC